MKKQIKIDKALNLFPSWLTPQLVTYVRKVFEPRYKRSLTDFEVVGIAENLTCLLELYFKIKRRSNER